MNQRLRSFLLYLFNCGPIFFTDCSPELEFIITHGILHGYITCRDNQLYATVKAKLAIL